IIVPSQDIVLGLYYLSLAKDNEPGQGKLFADVGEIESALEAGVVTLHSKIKGRFEQLMPNGKFKHITVDTTPGRMKLAELLPQHEKITYDLLSSTLTKKEIGNLIDHVYRHCGQKATVIFADRIMQLGFREACKAGISFGMGDMIVPKAKETLVEDTRKRV